MSETVNRAHRLRRRPSGDLADGDLELVTEEIPELTDGQALVRTELLSLDPTNRIWMSDIKGYMPPVPIDAVMRGLGIGEVVESRREDMPVGAKVSGFLGWQEYCLADDSLLEAPLSVLPDPLPAPLPAFLGALGHTGVTAYVGMEIGDVKEGETVVVSAACGAVGSVAGQIAKERGARAVGIAGGPEKCRHAVEALGYDACVDHRAADWREQLDAATPDGVDVDFENVGGEIMDHVLGRLNIGARIPLCGMISEYNAYTGENSSAGLKNIGQLIMMRATMTGFLVLDYADRFEEAIGYLAGLLGEGKLRYDETVVEGGIAAAPDAYRQLFTGTNVGKLLLRVAE
ncbi:MAG TPA: NADP-dependent oxidoreductase [Solirubrobacterales bacterium]